MKSEVKKTFALICYTFGRKFSFEAESLEAAVSLGRDWARSHGFCYRTEYTVAPVSSKENEYGQNDFHPEYIY